MELGINHVLRTKPRLPLPQSIFPSTSISTSNQRHHDNDVELAISKPSPPVLLFIVCIVDLLTRPFLQCRCKPPETTPRHRLQNREICKFGTDKIIASSRPLRARPSLLRSSPPIRLTMSSPRSRTRREFPRISNA
jgi:hypothetical protein